MAACTCGAMRRRIERSWGEAAGGPSSSCERPSRSAARRKLSALAPSRHIHTPATAAAASTMVPAMAAAHPLLARPPTESETPQAPQRSWPVLNPGGMTPRAPHEPQMKRRPGMRTPTSVSPRAPRRRKALRAGSLQESDALPRLTSAPGRSSACRTRLPSTQVPFALPRSSMRILSPRQLRRA
ncbi:MAG: hypothetical protein M5U28_39290 [Sandaracinaceae bacterium]|nr:hypothetical protein [Sandaracinaceae bacterium]